MPPSAKINHIAFVVKSIETALAFWRDALGLEVETWREVPAEQSRVAYLPAGNARIELVEPTTQDSGVARFLAKRVMDTVAGHPFAHMDKTYRLTLTGGLAEVSRRCESFITACSAASAACRRAKGKSGSLWVAGPTEFGEDLY